MKIFVKNELQNIAPRFSRAIWRKVEVNKTYKSARDAKKYHNLANCEYCHVNANGNIINTYNNARINNYGTRF